MDFQDKEQVTEIIGIMKDVSKQCEPILREKIHSLILNSEEKDIQEFVDGLGFKEGAWYRPMHNILVPAAMIAIIRKENLPRDLVYPAQLHDAGNSQLKIADTSSGASWENRDQRLKHMELGATMTATILLYKAIKGDIKLEDSRIKKLAKIVATHDFPYLGNPLTDLEELAHRDADRCFVPSALSFYKDLAAYVNDEGYQKKARDLGITLDPKTFLGLRLAFFYRDNSELPKDWDKSKYPLDTRMASFNEGGKVEPQTTRTGKEIIDFIFRRRALELESIDSVDLKEFRERFRFSLIKDTISIIGYATGNDYAIT